MRMIGLCCTAVLLMIICTPLALAQPNLKQAEHFIQQGRAEDAYNILHPYEFELSGNVEYDYLLGLAALESGRPDQATLAFERALAVESNFLGARLDLARAWFALNLFDLAKEELMQLQNLDPPLAAQKVIDTYLKLIEEKSHNAEKNTFFNWYLEARVGRDSNVNLSPDSAEIYLPAINRSVTLNPNSIGIKDSYFTMAAAANAAYQSHSWFGLTGGLEVVGRKLQRAKHYNTDNLNGHINIIAHGWNNLTLTVGAQYRQMYLNGNYYRSTPAIGFDVRWAENSKRAYSFFGQHIRPRFIDAVNKANNANITLFGIGHTFAFGDRGKTVYSISGYGGKDFAATLRTDGDKTLMGIKSGLKHALNSKIEGFAHFGFQHGNFNKINPLFQIKRRDDIWEADVGLVWRFLKGWTLRPSLSYSRSDSSIAIYDFTRIDYAMGVRYAF